MLSETMQTAISEQVNRELYSAYAYLSMSSWLSSTSMPGMAHWMRVQYQEELDHALKFVDYVSDRGGRVRFQAIGAPPAEFDSPLGAFRAALDHERHITVKLNELYELAMAEHDYASQGLLQWYVTEQVEEEKITGEIVARLELADNAGAGLLLIDSELGARSPEET